MKSFCFGVLAAITLGITSFVLPAKADPGPQTECIANLCIVYMFVRTEDVNGNFTGYAKVEVRRYWKTGDDWISAD